MFKTKKKSENANNFLKIKIYILVNNKTKS